MDEPLTRSDHLEFAEAQQQQRSLGSGDTREIRRGPSGPSVHPAEDLGSPHGEDDMVLLSVGQLQAKDLRNILYDGLFISAAYLIVGGAWLMASSDWSFTNTLYFMVISGLTIGYGDVTVRKQSLDNMVDSIIIVVGLAALGVWAAYAERASQVIRLRRDAGEDARPEFDADKSMRDAGRRLIIQVFIMIVLIFGGAAIFAWGENEYFTAGFYWAVVTASTIGYGDLVPTTLSMKWFTIVYSIIAVVWMLETLRQVGSYPFRLWAWRAQAKVFNQFSPPETPEERVRVTALAEHCVLQSLGVPLERPGCVSRSEFTLSMLLLLDRICYKDYQEVVRVFENLDVNGDGTIRPNPATVSVDAKR